MKLIPNYNNTIYNEGEDFFYKELSKSVQYTNVYMIYSLHIAEHIKQCFGEIDFLLIGEFGLICIEVKGGELKREHGVWFVDDRELRKSPFVQASDNIHSLRDNIKKYFQSVNKNFYIPTGYGVAFPFTNFKIQSSEWDNSIIYTSMDAQNNIDVYIKRLINYWTQKQKEKKSNYKPLDRNTIELIKNYLLGNFSFKISKLPYLKIFSEEIIKLTESQLEIYEGLFFNPRLLINGEAGSGKTLLAQRLAINKSQEGKKVILLFYNKLIALAIKEILKNQSKNNVQVMDIISFMISYIPEDKRKQIDSIEKCILLFKEYFKEDDQFDFMVIDEGQDFINNTYYDVLDKTIKGGLMNGEWAIFYDSEVQSYVYDKYDKEILEYIKIESKPLFFVLKKNCRNTINILRKVKEVTKYEIHSLLHTIDGEQVTLISYKNQEDQKNKIVSIINKLIKDGINKERIDMISLVSQNSSIFSLYKNEFTKLSIHEMNEVFIKNRKNQIGYSTVGKYKGLENDIILLTDFSYSKDLKTSALNYTGMTRARLLLYIFIESISYNELLKE